MQGIDDEHESLVAHNLPLLSLSLLTDISPPRAGWLITVDQYYYREVQYIIETVVTRLEMNPDRKFIYVEIAFFARWWYEQTPERQEVVKKLVASGQLEFINGGWCMHDEAAPHYVQMVDQTTRGHQFLMRHFGIRPSVTWQIDPFGHSNTEAWLLGAEAGMDALFFGRMDYQDFDVRKNESRTEWIWQGSESLGASAQCFTGELYGGGGGGYGPPIGSFNGGDNQIQDDPRQHDYNVDSWVDQVVTHAQDQASHTQTDHIMWAMGTDFNYQNAETWYHNLDRLIHYVNMNASVNAFYSTPSIYVKAKRASSVKWEVREDDIFPLADGPHHYWSGYFTSRSALKFWERIGAGYMNAARQLETLDDVTMKTDMLEAAVGVTTHHDGMSGSSKQAVADDYEQRVADGQGYTAAFVATSLAKRAGSSSKTVEQCRSLNMTLCEYTTETEGFTVSLWNQVRLHFLFALIRLFAHIFFCLLIYSFVCFSIVCSGTSSLNRKTSWCASRSRARARRSPIRTARRSRRKWSPSRRATLRSRSSTSPSLSCATRPRSQRHRTRRHTFFPSSQRSPPSVSSRTLCARAPRRSRTRGRAARTSSPRSRSPRRRRRATGRRRASRTACTRSSTTRRPGSSSA